MKKKLDPEGLGIILMNDFMYEFYPEDKKSVPDTFNLMHYNGIPNSNMDCKVSKNNSEAPIVLLLIIFRSYFILGKILQGNSHSIRK